MNAIILGTVLVTGAAGAIGSETAGLFLERGWHVSALDRDPAVEDKSGAGYHPIVADVGDEEGLVASLVTLADLPPLRHVVAIAGGALPSEPHTQTDPALVDLEDFRLSIDRNLTSQFITLKAALPWLAVEGDRSITLTSSFNALSGYGMPAYSAAKAGLIGLMNALVLPMGKRSIRVNVVAPGTIRTPRTEELWAGSAEHFEKLAAASALGRVGEPIDVARVFWSLAVEMTHVTGQTLIVDGGQSRYQR